MSQALADLQGLGAQQPSGLADSLRRDLAMERAAYSFRAGARQEELRLYELAGYASVENAVIPLLPANVQSPMKYTIAGLHSLYILAGIDQYYLVNVHFTHVYDQFHREQLWPGQRHFLGRRARSDAVLAQHVD